MSQTPRSKQIDADPTLPLDDVIPIVQLLGDIASMGGRLEQRRRALMVGLAKIIDADAWMWTISRTHPETKTATSLGLLHGGFSEEQVLMAIESSQSTDPLLPEHEPIIELLRRGRHFTRTRRQLVDDETWYASEANKKFRFAHNIDDFLYSLYPFEDGLLSGVGFHRWAGREKFTATQQRIVHIMLGTMRWLHHDNLPNQQGRIVAEMTPRLRTVLMLLLEGKGRDAIAGDLKISTHTAKDHISSVYEHFGVGSQVELLHLFQTGNGDDV